MLRISEWTYDVAELFWNKAIGSHMIYFNMLEHIHCIIKRFITSETRPWIFIFFNINFFIQCHLFPLLDDTLAEFSFEWYILYIHSCGVLNRSKYPWLVETIWNAISTVSGTLIFLTFVEFSSKSFRSSSHCRQLAVGQLESSWQFG